MQFRFTIPAGAVCVFKGSLQNAYWATVPLLAPALAMVALLMVSPATPTPPIWVGASAGFIALCTLAILPWLFWRLKSYQHMHYALGSLQTQFKATPGNFYRLFLNIIGFAVLAMLVPLLATGVLVYGAQLKASAAGTSGAGAAIGGLHSGHLAGRPCSLRGHQALCHFAFAEFRGTQTGNRSIRFVSKLRFRSLLWLTLKNWLFIVLTLGLYWPFAAVALARIRIEAVYLKTRINPDTPGGIGAHQSDATGDAAGDFFRPRHRPLSPMHHPTPAPLEALYFKGTAPQRPHRGPAGVGRTVAHHRHPHQTQRSLGRRAMA